VLSVSAADWTEGGLTVTVGSDGRLHVYRTGSEEEAVPSRALAALSGILASGRDDAGDVLTVDVGAILNRPKDAGVIEDLPYEYFDFDGGQGGGNALVVRDSGGRRERWG